LAPLGSHAGTTASRFLSGGNRLWRREQHSSAPDDQSRHAPGQLHHYRDQFERRHVASRPGVGQRTVTGGKTTARTRFPVKQVHCISRDRLCKATASAVRSKVTGPPISRPAPPNLDGSPAQNLPGEHEEAVGELCPAGPEKLPGYLCAKPLDFGLAFPLPGAVTSSCSQRPCSLAGPPRPLAAGAKTDTEHSRVSSSRTGFLRTLRAGVRIAAAPAERGHKDIEIESPCGRTEGRTTKTRNL
jgi:hypothetical protein